MKTKSWFPSLFMLAILAGVGFVAAVSQAEERTKPVAATGSSKSDTRLLASHNQNVAAIAVQTGRKPNILMIWGDDIGWNNPSAYNRGMMGYSTPNIDRVAK